MELSDLKIMLGLSDENKESDSLLNLIIKNTELSLRSKLDLKPGEGIPSELSYIPLEVAVRRFNRVRNEGMTSYSQEGESITFSNNDFDAFESDIEEYKRRNNSDGLLYMVDPYRRYDV